MEERLDEVYVGSPLPFKGKCPTKTVYFAHGKELFDYMAVYIMINDSIIYDGTDNQVRVSLLIRLTHVHVDTKNSTHINPKY